MADVYSILKINRESFSKFHLQANLVENIQTEKIIRHQVKLLKQIEERVGDDRPAASRQSVQEIVDKVYEKSRNGVPDMSEWSVRELRIVSYYLIKLQGDDDVFHFALSIISDGWHSTYLNGIAFFLLNSWCNIKPSLRQMTCKLFTARLQEYNGSNMRIRAWRNHANYFDEAGPLRMLQLLLAHNASIHGAPSLLGYKENALAQSFYSDVIIGYARKKQLGLDELGQIFEKHNNARTKKLILAEYVEKADKRGNTEEQAYLSNFVNKTLGDVTLAATWSPFPGATNEEAQSLKKAMRLAKKWFARKIIETFFIICVQDKQREQFWLRYVPNISGFRIVGSTLTKQRLRNDPTTSDMFMPFFIETNSRLSQTSALVLSIKDKVIIEFSDVGALYVYDQDDVAMRFLRNDARRIVSTRDLKNPSMGSLVSSDNWGYYSFYGGVGKMNHQGNWANRLDNWMRRIVLKEDNTSVSFYESRDNGRFTAQPYSEDDIYTTD